MQNKDKIICAGKLELNKTLFLLHDPATQLFVALTLCITHRRQEKNAWQTALPCQFIYYNKTH